MAWRLHKMTNREDARKAILWFEHQFQNHYTHSPERHHLRNLKHYFSQIEHVNTGLIRDTETMHFSLAEIIRKLTHDMN